MKNIEFVGKKEKSHTDSMGHWKTWKTYVFQVKNNVVVSVDTNYDSGPYNTLCCEICGDWHDLFQSCGILANIEGSLTSDEVKELKKFLSNFFGLNPQYHKVYINFVDN